MSWWEKLIRKSDQKINSKPDQTGAAIFKDLPKESESQDLTEYDIDNIRTLLLQAFTLKEIFSLVELIDNKSITEKVHGDKNKLHIVRLILDEGEYSVLLVHAKTINQKKFDKHTPYIRMKEKLTLSPNLDQERESIPSVSEVSKSINSQPVISKVAETKHDEFESFKESDKQIYQRKLLRREIKRKLHNLSILDNCDIGEILEILIKYKDSRELLLDAARELKSANRFPIDLIEKISLEHIDKISEDEIYQKAVDARFTWIERKLSTPILIKVDIGENGPKFQAITREMIYRTLCDLFGKAAPDFQVINIPAEITKIGTYGIGILFSKDVALSGYMMVDLNNDPFPIDCVDCLSTVKPLDLVETKDIFQQITAYLDDLTENMLVDETKMSRVLVTAYKTGYWKTSTIQNVLENWRKQRSKKNERGTTDNEAKNSERIGLINNLFRFNNNLDIGISELSDIVRDFRDKATNLRNELLDAIDLDSQQTDEFLPDLSAFWGEINKYSKLPPKEFSNKLSALVLSCINRNIDYKINFGYLDKDIDNLTKYCLARYYFSKGSQIYLEGMQKESRQYLVMSLFFNSMTSGRAHNHIEEEYYYSLSRYFGSYDINFDLKNRPPSTAEEFYDKFIEVVPTISNIIPLGRCILEISVADLQFSSNLVEFLLRGIQNANLKKPGRQLKTMTELKTIVSSSLKDTKIFCMDPIRAIRILDKLEPASLGEIFLAIYNDSKNEGAKNLVITSFMKFMTSSNTLVDVYLEKYIKQASDQSKSALAFLILTQIVIDPKTGQKDNDNSQLKADLITKIIGLQPGTKERELLYKRISEFSSMFRSFFQALDNNRKGELGSEIQDALENTQRWLNEYQYPINYATSLFIRKINDYLQNENAKLIRDTKLEVRLKTNKIVYSQSKTRIVLEISNIGDGPAEWLELHVFSVKGQYDVPDSYRIIRIKTIEQKHNIQKEIFILPQDESIKTLNLNIELRYSTLYQKDQKVALNQENRRVELIPLSKYKRIPLLYSISAPATQLFYGRHNDLEGIADNLFYNNISNTMADNLHPEGRKDNSMIVYGIKRAGKTSVIKRFMDRTLKERGLDKSYLSIYVDVLADPNVRSVRTDNDFLYFLINVIVNELPESVRKTLDINLISFQSDFQSDPLVTFSYILDEILKAIAPMRLLVILDEFSTLRPKFELLSKDMIGFLSNTIQDKLQLTFIFTGTYLLLDMMNDYAIDIAKFCTTFMIAFLDEKSARQLVTEPFLKTGMGDIEVELDPKVVDQILAVTNLHPFLIQYVMILLIDKMNRLKASTINLLDFEDIVHQIVTEPEHQQPLYVMWDEFDILHKKALSTIAALSTFAEPAVDAQKILNIFNEQGELLPIERILSICSNLVGAKLLNKTTGKDTSYEISIPLYKMWLQHNKPIASIFAPDII